MVGLDFDTLIDYALDNRLRGLIAEICGGWAVPAFEQPCWECGEMRYFRRMIYPGPMPGDWFEQCVVHHPARRRDS